MDGFGVAANSMFPWVDQGDAARAEITDIARDHRESIHQGRGSDQRISFIGLVGPCRLAQRNATAASTGRIRASNAGMT